MLFLAQDPCVTLRPVISFLKAILAIIQWGIPILLIIMGSIDLGKAVMASDDKEIKGATSKLIKRAIAAVAVFFIPLLVNLLIGMVGDSDGDETNKNEGDFASCWKNASNNSPSNS